MRVFTVSGIYIILLNCLLISARSFFRELPQSESEEMQSDFWSLSDDQYQYPILLEGRDDLSDEEEGDEIQDEVSSLDSDEIFPGPPSNGGNFGPTQNIHEEKVPLGSSSWPLDIGFLDEGKGSSWVDSAQYLYGKWGGQPRPHYVNENFLSGPTLPWARSELPQLPIFVQGEVNEV